MSAEHGELDEPVYLTFEDALEIYAAIIDGTAAQAPTTVSIARQGRLRGSMSNSGISLLACCDAAVRGKC